MKNWTIGKRMTAGFASVALVAVALGVFAYAQVRSINYWSDLIGRDAIPGIGLISDMASVSKDIRGAILRHIISDTGQDKAAIEADIQRLTAEYDRKLKEYEGTITKQKDRDLFEAIKSTLAEYREARQRVLALSREQKGAEAFAMFKGELKPIMDRYFNALDAEVAFNRENAAEYDRAIDSEVGFANAGIVVGLLLAVLLSVGVSYVVVRTTNGVLSASVTELTAGSQQVSAASGQVATASQSLSQGATEQAASLEETSASMEEMASMTRRNAENSQSAAQLMVDVDTRVRTSNESLHEMVASMAAIEESSQKVSKIIKTIDEIAFQTNILALNAAVEAARAGEAGMGFAVVADEVRNLAQRSAQAAKDTASLIEESIAKAQNGSAKVDQVSSAIAGITESVTKVKGLVDEVSVASRQQSQGIDQVSQAIAQMEKVTQTTAATAEESAAASEELSAQAETTMGVVQQLGRLVGAQQTAAVAPRSPATPAAGRPAAKVVKMAAPRRAAAPPTPAMSAEDAIPMNDTGTYGKF